MVDPTVGHFPKVHLDASVTVGISAYGNANIALIALRALFNAAQGDYELLLVNDCSPDQGQVRDLFLQVRSERRQTRVFSFERNLEYSGSLNCILSHARGSTVLFLSNDILVTPGYLRELLAVARQEPQAGIVRGVSNFVDNGSAQHNVLPQGVDSSRDIFQFGEDRAQAYRGVAVRDRFLTGDAFLVTREVIQTIGTFDPLFYGYFADHDYGIRAECAGFRLLLARGAFAYHLQGMNVSTLSEAEAQAKVQRRWARVNENWARFKLKYGLAVERPYTPRTLLDLDWQALASETFEGRHFTAPGDYAKFEMP